MQSLKIASLVTPVWERSLILSTHTNNRPIGNVPKKEKKGMIVIFYFFKKGDVLNKTNLNKGKNANIRNTGDSSHPV